MDRKALIVLIFLFIVLLIILLCNRKRRIIERYSDDRYKLCIMAIFKNEHEYMKEWLDHHIKQGVSHFYLYSNDPNMQNYPYLTQSKYKKKVTLIPWVNVKHIGKYTVQRQAYTHCIKNYNAEFRYIMMLDLDEFIDTFTENNDKKEKLVIDVIDTLDQNNTKSIKVMRFNYGSNGNLKKPKGTVMNNYTKHQKWCSSFKTIANVDHIDTDRRFFCVHDYPYKRHKTSAKIYNKFLRYKKGLPSGCDCDSKTEVDLIVKHYFTKSKEEYIDRCKLWKDGKGVNILGRGDCENNFKDKDVNDIEGYDYLPCDEGDKGNKGDKGDKSRCIDI